MLRGNHPSLLVGALVTLGLFGCSSGRKEPTFPDEPASAKASDPDMPASAPKENLPPGTVSRVSLDQWLMRGPGWFLSKIQMEEVLRQNKFIGWRLIAFPKDWDGSGLQPGDVVTDVNGTSLERPDEFWNLWLAASEANEIKIGFERNGQPSTAIIKIQGAPKPETKLALEKGAMVPPPAQSGPPAKGTATTQSKGRFQTKVIGGDGPEPIETSDY